MMIDDREHGNNCRLIGFRHRTGLYYVHESYLMDEPSCYTFSINVLQQANRLYYRGEVVYRIIFEMWNFLIFLAIFLFCIVNTLNYWKINFLVNNIVMHDL